MKQPDPVADWPDSWSLSYKYDLEEVYGQPQHLGYSYAYANRRSQTLALLTEAVQPGARILDLAAGQGNFSLALAELGYSVTWNDIRAELEGYVRMKHEFGDLEFAPGNAFELEFPELFDAIVMTEVIEHVAHPDEFLANATRLVRPGGHIVLTTPNGGYFRNSLPRFSDCADPSVFESAQFGPNSDDHIFLLHTDELTSLAKSAGLMPDRVTLFTNPLTNGHVKLGPALKVLPRRLVFGIESLSQHLPEAIGRRLLVQMGARLRTKLD